MTNIFVLAICLQDVFKTFPRRLQDVLPRQLQDVFKTSSRSLAKTSSRHLQDVFKTSSRRLAKTSSRRLQNVFKWTCKNVFMTFSRRLRDIFKASCKDVFKTFSRGIIRLNCFPRSRTCLQPPKKIVAKTKNFPFPQLSMQPLVMRWKEPEGNKFKLGEGSFFSELGCVMQSKKFQGLSHYFAKKSQEIVSEYFISF